MFICEECIEKHEPLPMPGWIYPRSYGPCELCHKINICIDFHGDLPPLKKRTKNKKNREL